MISSASLVAIPPDDLRELVRDAINRHLDQDSLAKFKVAEESERKGLDCSRSRSQGAAALGAEDLERA